MDVLPDFKVFQYLLVQNKHYKAGRMNFISCTNMDVASEMLGCPSQENNEWQNALF